MGPPFSVTIEIGIITVVKKRPWHCAPDCEEGAFRVAEEWRVQQHPVSSHAARASPLDAAHVRLVRLVRFCCRKRTRGIR